MPRATANAGIMNRMTSYGNFWPYYLREHGRRETRAIHYAGTALTLVFLGIALAEGGW